MEKMTLSLQEPLGVQAAPTIESEMRRILSSVQTSRPDAKQDQNVRMITYFYGFGGSTWPTLEETAQSFGVTRQRVLQIKQRDFVYKVNMSDLPSLQSFSLIVQEQEYWLYSDLKNRIIEAGLVKDMFSIRGLLNMLGDLGNDSPYDVCTPELTPATRGTIDKFHDHFVIRKPLLAEAKNLYKKVKALPGIYGLAQLDYLIGKDNEFRSLAEAIIRLSDEAWGLEKDGCLWYLFENRDNVLINYSRKVFALTPHCSVKELAETYANALRARKQKHPYAPIEIIEAYLGSSKMFDNANGICSYIGTTRDSLSPIEQELAGFLANRVADFPTLRTHRKSQNYTDPNIVRAVMFSPLVSIDKSRGRGNYEYRLVGNNGIVGQNNNSDEVRYAEFRNRLRELGATDETIEQKQRREQRILRDWLFADNRQGNCAICEEEYSVNALVSAHKKNRSKCSTSERIDPYIVMPICIFGCDFLYEHRYIFIRDGHVIKGTVDAVTSAEEAYLAKVIGRRIDAAWLKGPTEYFE